MFRKIFFLIPLIVPIIFGSGVKAETFSIFPTQDAYVANDTQQGPDSVQSGGDGIHIRNQAGRRRVGYLKYDISALKTGDETFTNVSFSLDGWDAGDIVVYGIKEQLDSINVNILSWNTAPGVQNNPTPALDSPVELDFDDLVGPLMTCQAVSRSRESTETSQELADFLNSDVDGIVVFLFAPAEEGDAGIILSIEDTPASSGTLLEGNLEKAVGFATEPNPGNETDDVPRDVILSWTPGEYAATHNVYLGSSFEDVNSADATSPLLVGPAQDVNNFNAGRLEFEKTYFWRVDEVNAPPDSTVFKGKVWSFKVETFAITVPSESITATASSQAGDQGPEQTINGSGLDANDLHSTDTTAMWLTAMGETGQAWIQYEFDQPYKLYQMLVWNYNGESILSLFGIMDVTVEYSMDEITWTQVDSVSQFTQAPGTDGYASNTTVSFDGVAAKYVRILPTSIWGSDIFGNTQFGLSEVQFLAIPVSARYPSPEDAATDIAVGVTVSWRPGREAAVHEVYISADEQAVMDGTAPVTTVSQASDGPLSLDLGSTYFWRVDEVNNAEVTPVWEGKAWSFSTQEYLVVDDFESYNDVLEGDDSNLVYMTWSDGYVSPPAVRTNGSTMGYLEAFEPTMETTIVYGGSQSAPLFYDNTSVSVSEVTADTSKLAIGRNWTIGSPTTLVLYVYGDPENNAATDRMYVKVNNSKVVFDGNISRPEWMQWNIDLAALGINLSNVTQLAIGIERIGNTGGSGMVFIDEIRLYRIAPPVPVEEVWVEAESGTVSAPMMKYDDPNASGGQYVSTVSGTADVADAPPYPDGTVTIPFTVEGGTYTVRLRVGFPGGADSCWVRIPDATVQSAVTPLADGWLHFNDIPTGDYWHWSQEVKNEGGTEPPVEFTLSAGTHNLEISYRAATLRFDAVVFSRAE